MFIFRCGGKSDLTFDGREVKFKMAASPPVKSLSSDIGGGYKKNYRTYLKEN